MKHQFPILNIQQHNGRAEGVKGLQYNDILPAHFCWSIVGSPGSGKTTFIQNLMHGDQFYRNKFEYVFVISPSNIKIDGVDSECVSKTFKIDWIYERLNYLITKNLSGQNLLIVLDDCISQIKQYQNDKMLIDLFFNRRHLWPNNTISIILTTQQFTMMPLRFRAVCDHFTFLSLSPRDFDFIKKELVYSSSRKCMSQVVETFQGPPYQFIYIKLQPFLLCQNFKPMIKGSDYVCLSSGFQSISQDASVQRLPEKKMPAQQEATNFPSHPQTMQKNALFYFNKK